MLIDKHRVVVTDRALCLIGHVIRHPEKNDITVDHPQDAPHALDPGPLEFLDKNVKSRGRLRRQNIKQMTGKIHLGKVDIGVHIPQGG